MKSEMFFKNNLTALSEKYPKLAKKIGETRGSGSYKLIRSKTGYPNVLIEREADRVLFYDVNDPVQSAQQFLEELKIKYAPLVFFMGLGLGYHLDVFMRLLSHEWGAEEVIIYERDVELFRLALFSGDYTQLLRHPNIHFFIGGDPEDSFVKLRTDIFIRDIYALRSVKIVPIPSSIVLDCSYYQGVMKTIRQALRQVMIMVGNDSFDSLLGLENMFGNLKHVFSNPGINELYGRFKKTPGVLVAAGPSLNKNMHFLKGLRDKALIISCDASFGPLMQKGIRPHIVTSLERTPGVDLFYTSVDNFKDIYFVALPVIMPEVIDAFKGRKFIAYRNYPYFKWLEIDKGTLNVGISVANLAFKILTLFECDPIILIGQDLAYADDGETHVKGNIFGERDETILSKPVIEIEGNYGKPVKSEKLWEVMKLIYEEDIVAYPGTCINATEGGAKIKGAEIMPFKEAIERYCQEPFHPRTILNEVYDHFVCRSNTKDEMKRIYHKTQDTRKIVEAVIDCFETALNEAHGVDREIIEPYIKDKTDSSVDMSRLLSVERKWLELSATVNDNRPLYEITGQTLQAYDVWLASELSFLKDIYTNKDMLSMARVRKMTEWFSVVASFLVFTRNVLQDTEMTLKKEMQSM